MKWPTWESQRQKIMVQLTDHSRQKRRLIGIASQNSKEVLATQMVASIRRLEFTRICLSRDIHASRTDPYCDMFDPEKAAIFHSRAGNFEEAVWLIFLSVQFGKHKKYGWLRMRDVYSGLGSGVWTWAKISNDPKKFRSWLAANETKIRGAFGNHRRYESIDGLSKNGTGSAIESYVDWIMTLGSHRKLFGELVKSAGNDPETIFNAFYQNMSVARFGRLGKFDFLSMLGRLGLAPIIPGKAYLEGATGPLRGARLLFFGNTATQAKVDNLEDWLKELDSDLSIGMQPMEDALCNWQKSPTEFVHFIG